VKEHLAMSATITIDEAQAKLKELIHQLAPWAEVVITENHRPVARFSERGVEAEDWHAPAPWPG
jgi:hypothetical protein